MAGHDVVKKAEEEVDVPARPDPFAGFFGLRRAMDDMFDRFFRGFDLSPASGAGSAWHARGALSPKIDITEDEKEMRITAELPGIDEKDLQIEIVNDVLTIKGEKKVREEEKKKDYYRLERSFGSFRRSIVLPGDVDRDKAEAELKAGVLTLRFPKLPEAEPKRKEVTIKTA